ncbi:MAG: hypothetical protein AB7T63_00925 [Planctomycetota bacterium]
MRRILRLVPLALVVTLASVAGGCKPAARVITRGVVIKNIRDQQREQRPQLVRGTRPPAVQQRWRATQGQ